MHGYVIDRIGDAAEEVGTAQGARALADAVERFVEVLECLSHYPAATFHPEALREVEAHGERVIAVIERAVESRLLEAARVRRLIDDVYGIRCAVASVYRFSRNPLRAVGPVRSSSIAR
jgi:hypothetical protein